MKSVGQFLDDTIAGLPGRETPALDAQVLLAHVIKRPRPWILAHPEAPLSPAEAQAAAAAAKRLQEGEPLPYILGRWEFFGLEFNVTPEVLIPRPETELLVEHALGWLQEHPQARRAADVGTGSGCIAISLAVHCRDLRLAASDLSLPAVQVAQANARKHGVSERIDFIQADLLPKTLTACDLIAANLPYIPSAALAGLAVFGREPALALDGGPDGLWHIRRLLQQAGPVISTPSLIVLEIEASQGPAVLNMSATIFPQAQAQLYRDLAGLDRLIEIRF